MKILSSVLVTVYIPKKGDKIKQRDYVISFFSASTLDLSDTLISGRETLSPSCTEKKNNLITFFSNHIFKILVKISLRAAAVTLCKHGVRN